MAKKQYEYTIRSSKSGDHRCTATIDIGTENAPRIVELTSIYLVINRKSVDSLAFVGTDDGSSEKLILNHKLSIRRNPETYARQPALPMETCIKKNGNVAALFIQEEDIRRMGCSMSFSSSVFDGFGGYRSITCEVTGTKESGKTTFKTYSYKNMQKMQAVAERIKAAGNNVLNQYKFNQTLSRIEEMELLLKSLKDIIHEVKEQTDKDFLLDYGIQENEIKEEQK